MKEICPKCKSTSIVKNGKTKDNIQKYLCRSCKKSFVDKLEKPYKTVTDRRLLSFLINLIEAEPKSNRDLKDLLELSRNGSQKIRGMKFKLIEMVKPNLNFAVVNMHLLISKENDTITFYKLKTLSLEDGEALKINNSVIRNIKR